MPAENEIAPDFEAKTDEGKDVKLSDFHGRRVVLYFYPKDDTPGCTKEACGFRDAYADYAERGIVVLGVSPDDVASHQKFKSKFDLNFTLLADPDHGICEAYGVWGEKTLYGRKYMGVSRTTFLIDEDGRIARVFPKVKPEGHAEQILEAFGD